MPSNILILDDNEMLLRIMGEVVETFCNRSAIKAKSLAQIKEHEDAALSCGVAFLDINLGPDEPNGIDAYHWLQTKAFRGQTYFFTGHAHSHPLVAKACALGTVKVLSKPISLESLEKILAGHP